LQLPYVRIEVIQDKKRRVIKKAKLLPNGSLHQYITRHYDLLPLVIRYK